MSNTICLIGENVKEEVSSSEFGALKRDVHHIGKKLDKLEEQGERTAEAIQAISISTATMTEHIKQNSKLGVRVSRLEKIVWSAIGGFSVVIFIVKFVI